MKNLLITGGSQGIGKATALEAAKKGMFIGINYNSNDKAAEETLSEVKQLGGEGILLKCDVSQNSAVKDMFKNFVDTTGSVWTARFVFFGLSYLVFPISAYLFLNESPFTLKTALCTLLSILIIAIQCKM